MGNAKKYKNVYLQKNKRFFHGTYKITHLDGIRKFPKYKDGSIRKAFIYNSPTVYLIVTPS